LLIDPSIVVFGGDLHGLQISIALHSRRVIKNYSRCVRQHSLYDAHFHLSVELFVQLHLRDDVPPDHQMNGGTRSKPPAWTPLGLTPTRSRR
jgi:hypothetical protein